MARTQGGNAVRTGNVLEAVVTGTFTAHGFQCVAFNAWQKAPENFSRELLLHNVPYTTIYGGRGFTEFQVASERHNLLARIECKWQQTTGSVDEKLPYTYLSCVEAIPEPFVIILIDGDGFRPGAIQWLRDAARKRLYIPPEKPDKRIAVMNTTEFLTWCNQLFR
ncbi:MAG: PD-(D/E)XK nuclease superfamily protein [Gammaproteobacteria bacterium]